jgi:hypothetical protein
MKQITEVILRDPEVTLKKLLHSGHRFKKLITQIIVLALGSWLLTSSIYAQSISSKELIENAKTYDAKTISYQGEVIGEVMCRGDYCWVNLNDGKNAIGIWLPKTSASIINYKGSYKAEGDWLEVTGIFNRACREHSGDLDIHAINIRKVKEGNALQEQINLKKRNLSLILLGILCLILILKRLKTS